MGVPLSRNSGRLFLPGDRLDFEPWEENAFHRIRLYELTSPRRMIGSPSRGNQVGYLDPPTASVVVLQAFRDDQHPFGTARPEPLVSALVLAPPFGVCWMFVHLFDKRKVNVWPYPSSPAGRSSVR